MITLDTLTDDQIVDARARGLISPVVAAMAREQRDSHEGGAAVTISKRKRRRCVVKKCQLCKINKRSTPYVCTNCAARCCEHMCTNKKSIGVWALSPCRNAIPSWCGTCARLRLGSPERIARKFREH